MPQIQVAKSISSLTLSYFQAIYAPQGAWVGFFKNKPSCDPNINVPFVSADRIDIYIFFASSNKIGSFIVENQNQNCI